MKAMILAAGFGTRLRPFTEKIPKPLFTVAERHLLDILICRLRDAGCSAIIINTHHLHQKIESFVDSQDYTIPVYTRYEPIILGTGGAIKNVTDFWDNEPFMVINSDVITNIDFRAVYQFHVNHTHPVTLVLHDDPEFNKVAIDKDNFITAFSQPTTSDPSPLTSNLTFTGIQVLDPEVLDFIPRGVFSSSIDAYKNIISSGKKIKGFIATEYYWKDIGTPERYREAIMEAMIVKVFGKSGVRSQEPETQIPNPKSQIPKKEVGKQKSQFQISNFKAQISKLKGDGSDRKWFRISLSDESLALSPETALHSVIMADHGIKNQSSTSEADAFVNIGKHLYHQGVPVPEIYLHDTFSGLVFMEDLGDLNLQAVVRNTDDIKAIISYYQSVIDLLIQLSLFGAKDFNLAWTYQTPYYDKELILEKECRYFIDAFLRGYLGLDVRFEDFQDEFISLADKALEFSMPGFMHRDMQSRNIMVLFPQEHKNQIHDPKLRLGNKRFYFIDFQGGRIGPIQYDLASLLIDPYVALPTSVQMQLLDYCVKKLSSLIQIDPIKFRTCYQYCAITRNFQILGAFGYLSRVKGKSYFEQYIPVAIKTLKQNFSFLDNTEFPCLKRASLFLGNSEKKIILN